ncbi:MAG: hypothetical protein AAB368_06445, partial [bacterium]
MPGVPALPEPRWEVLGPDGRQAAGGARPRGRWHRASIEAAKAAPFDVRGYDPERALYEWEGGLPPIKRRADEYAARFWLPEHVQRQVRRAAPNGQDATTESVKTPIEVAGRFQLMERDGRGVRMREQLVRGREEFWALARTPGYRAAKLLEAGDFFSTGADASLPVPQTDPLQLSNTEFAPVVGGPFCVHGDTRVPLLDGTAPTIRELAETRANDSFWVYSCTRDGRIVPGRAHGARRTGERLSCDILSACQL